MKKTARRACRFVCHPFLLFFLSPGHVVVCFDAYSGNPLCYPAAFKAARRALGQATTRWIALWDRHVGGLFPTLPFHPELGGYHEVKEPVKELAVEWVPQKKAENRQGCSNTGRSWQRGKLLVKDNFFREVPFRNLHLHLDLLSTAARSSVQASAPHSSTFPSICIPPSRPFLFDYIDSPAHIVTAAHPLHAFFCTLIRFFSRLLLLVAMSTDAKEAKKQAELKLVGQDSEDVRAVVKAQRELKKKNDALRKATKALKGTKADNQEAVSAATKAVEKATAEVRAVERTLAELAGASVPNTAAVSTRPDAVPDTTAASPSPSPPSAAATDVEREAKKEAEMRFAGQNSDEARAAVKAQRELKKKEAALRKVQKELKGVDAEAKADYAEWKGKETSLLKEIAELSAICGGSNKDGVPKSQKTPPAPSSGSKLAPATATAMAVKGAPAGETKEATAADTEATAARLAAVVQRAMDENRQERRHVVPRDGVVHPRVAEVAILMEQMLLVGGSARVLALISAFRELLRATTVLAVPTLNEVDTTAFEKLIQINFDFVRRKREASAGMRYVKDVLVRRFVALRDEVIHPKPQAAALINDLGNPREVTLKILDMVEAELKMSFKSIVEDRSLPYVSNSDTILVFGRSSVVEYILLSRSHEPQCKPKRVIVVDAAPLFEGRQLADKLSCAGIEVTYGLITACCTLMPKCTRIFLGASAVLQNGDVFGRCGMALVAACAKLFRKPVLCFSESYKFVAEVWVGNLAQNTKLADMRPTTDTHGDGGSRSPITYQSPPTLSPPPPRVSSSWGTPTYTGDFFARSSDAMPFSVSASGYLYDLTPASYVDMIICEMGCLHTSAIVAAIKDRESREVSQLAYIARS
jgi:translation initiation factor eIF-2B subunit delta